MITHIKPLDAIPTRVKAFARLWAMKTIAQHPDWKSGDLEIDEWYDFSDYDINLWVSEGYLSVCVYPTFDDDDGWRATDHSNFVKVVQRGSL